MGDAMAGMGANLFSTAVTRIADNDMMEQDRGERQQFAWEQMSAAQQYNTNMDNTKYQRRVGDLEKAGLNPILAATQGPGPAPTSPVPSSAGGFTYGGPNNAFSAGAEATLAIKQGNVADAQADKTKAEADEIRARTPTHQVNIDKMRQDITESQERIKLLQADVQKSYTTASNIAQQTINLQAELPRIAATVTNLRSMTELNQAQRDQLKKQGNLTDAQVDQLQQHIRANIPELERQLKAMQLTAERAAQPGHANAQAAAESFAGQYGAYLRALLPIANILNAR